MIQWSGKHTMMNWGGRNYWTFSVGSKVLHIRYACVYCFLSFQVPLLYWIYHSTSDIMWILFNIYEELITSRNYQIERDLLSQYGDSFLVFILAINRVNELAQKGWKPGPIPQLCMIWHRCICHKLGNVWILVKTYLLDCSQWKLFRSYIFVAVNCLLFEVCQQILFS